ncbi:phage head-tail adapter protein [uncultured Ruminococcus sp.]|uniref:phage head-tail adapter protein n=1 Tax=uncultured Ruminococcus sp. TaxID=165186 RepID=UPI0025EC7505|nr:phage head-tail adapter protein [uncultured Ruminococcus sp.]
MNKEWSDLNKAMQQLLKKRDTFNEGIAALFRLRDELYNTMLSLREELSRGDFDAMPYPKAKGYHCKNIAYSMWHIFRIEDITANTLIADREQVFFTGDYQRRINSPIITTGNELSGDEIASFTKVLDIGALYEYISDVKQSTEDTVLGMDFDKLKTKIPTERREKLISLEVVSRSEDAFWLVDYWCGKDIRGLIQMPFSRHHIMHTEAMLRIRDGLPRRT